MKRHFLPILFVIFLLGACVGAGNNGAPASGLGGGGDAPQAQPSIADVNNVEPATPVEDCAPNDFDCEAQKKGLAPNPPSDPEPPPHGPGDLTM